MTFEHKLLIYKVEDRYGGISYTQSQDHVQAMKNVGLVYHILGSIDLETHLCYNDGVLFLLDTYSGEYVQLNTNKIGYCNTHYEYQGIHSIPNKLSCQLLKSYTAHAKTIIDLCGNSVQQKPVATSMLWSDVAFKYLLTIFKTLVLSSNFLILVLVFTSKK